MSGTGCNTDGTGNAGAINGEIGNGISENEVA